jgi:hypothetical protein
MTALKLFFQQRKQKLFSLTMVFLLGFTFHGFSKGPITAATVSTDKTDYLPGQHVSVTGKYWQPGETVKLTFTESPLIHPEQYINTVADASGNIYNADYLIQDHDLGQAFTLTAIGLSSGFNAVTLFTDGESADLDQVRNGSAASPDVTNLWANGAAVESQAHYAEGMSIPYRMRLDNLIDIAGKPSGQHELIISWDITKGGKHAIDYITSYNNIDYPVGTHQAAFGHGPEPIDPLSGTPIVTGMGPASTYPIPAPSSAGSPVTGQPTASFNSLSTLSSGIQTAMTIYNGTIINIVYVSQGSLGTGDNSTTLKITFTTTNSSVVFAWGGHIATESDWGLGQGASGISGSPYHTSLVSLDGSGGNQDRALAAAAVVIPPRVDINGISGGPVVACPETNSLVYNGTILNPNADPVTYSWSLLNNTAGAIIGGSSSGVMAGNIAVVPPLTVVPMGADFTPGGTFNIMLTVSRGVSTDIAYIGSDVYPGANVVITNLQVSAAASPSSINLLISNTSQLSTTVSGGATPYTYSWSADVSGGSLSSHGISDPVFTATAPGIYNYIVTVTENNGCVKTATVKIGVPDPGPTCSVTGLSPVCGTSINTYSGATVTVPEGATFTWTLEANGGGGSTDAVFTSNGLKMLVLNAGASNSISVTAGSQGYRVIVSEVYSNTALNSTCNKDVNVNTIVFTATPTQPKCNGDLGSVLLSTPTGGTGTITFDGTATSGLAEGDYTYTATDANGCKTTQKIHINAAPTAISFTATPTQPKCNGDLGSVLLSTPTGGTGTITFDGTATSGLAEGDYTYTATDANGCKTTQKVHINVAPTAISFTATPTQPKCNGDLGSVLLSTPTGGTGTITFDGTATSGLAEGDYTYTATDANGCKATQTVHINAAPSQLILTATPSPENCVSKDGSVSLSVNGGTAPYKFKWVNANSLSVTLATTKDLANVAAGTYSVTVTDNNNCTATISATVTRGACVPLYTYTQGYYSSTGTSCTPLGGTKGATALIQYALDNLDKQIGLPIPHNEQIYLGKTGASFTLNYADAANLVKVMPGGGTATKLTANYSFPLPSTILKNGKINNVLLAQTITLGLNINIQGDGLGNFILHTQFLTTMSGAGTACPIVMATCSNGGVVSSLKLSSNAAFLAYLDNKMVSDLYAMASAALGGTLPVIANGTVSYTDINNAIDVINRSFDGGRFFLGYYDVAPTCSTLSASKPRTYSNIFGNAPARTMYQPKIVEEEKVTTLSATAYPNPFTDRVKFSIVSPVSGKASLDVYNMMGQKIKTVYNGYLFANRTQVIDYSIPSSVKGALIYTLRVGDKQVNGKVVQMK